MLVQIKKVKHFLMGISCYTMSRKKGISSDWTLMWNQLIAMWLQSSGDRYVLVSITKPFPVRFCFSKRVEDRAQQQSTCSQETSKAAGSVPSTIKINQKSVSPDYKVYADVQDGNVRSTNQILHWEICTRMCNFML